MTINVFIVPTYTTWFLPDVSAVLLRAVLSPPIAVALADLLPVLPREQSVQISLKKLHLLQAVVVLPRPLPDAVKHTLNQMIE